MMQLLQQFSYLTCKPTKTWKEVILFQEGKLLKGLNSAENGGKT